MEAGHKKQIDVNRLRADVSACAVELLSAQCAADRVRLQYSPQTIVAFAEPKTLKRALASVEALHHFFSQIGAQINQEDGNSRAR
ncbi:MAG TPA: hypothetical protein VFE61_22760 [Candidatus Sulfotelmatobacter sp.]|jgi:hypothetical protein|nr:hypothetical protein [Candidatus Sulfotelmatobacter sp.]